VTTMLDHDSPAGATPDPPRRRWTPLLVAVAVAAVLVGVTLGVTRPGWLPGGGDRLPLLRIGQPGGGVAQGAEPGSISRAGRYVLRGTLPDGPSSAPVHRLRGGSPDADLVARLAIALGLAGTPQRDDEGYLLRDGGSVLRVYAAPGQPWVFARADWVSCPPFPLDGYTGADTAVSCGVARPVSPSQPPTPTGPTADALRSLARPILDSLGVGSDAAVTASPGDPVGQLVANPRVAGLATVGAGTIVSADSAGVTTATGWLATPRATDAYPLVSAATVFADLANEPEPAMGAPCTPEGCPQLMDIVVTGADLGLSLAFDGDDPVLVPAWLFRIDGSADPLWRIAVDPAFLAPPVDTADPGTSGGGSPPDPGATEPGSEPGVGAEPPAMPPTAG